MNSSHDSFPGVEKSRTVRVGHSTFHIDRRYSHLKLIGSGAYGVVASAVDKTSGRKVAIKKVKDIFQDLDEARNVVRELKLLRHFGNHENVVQLLDIMVPPSSNGKVEDVYIVTNFMDRDLARIIDSKQVFSDQHLQYFLFQILRGLKYVHSANVLHRDLKPSNVVVNLNCDLALCDFGLARGFGLEEAHLTEYVVTRHYRPPELLLECAKYGKPVDVWSVGCIFAELILRKLMFCGETPQHQLRLIVNKLGMPCADKLAFVDSREALRELRSIPPCVAPPFSALFPPTTNPSAVDLLEKMLRFNPEDRITVEQALSHEYLKDFHGHMSEPVCENLFDFGAGLAALEITASQSEREEKIRLLMLEEVRFFRPEIGSTQAEGSLPISASASSADSSVGTETARSLANADAEAAEPGPVPAPNTASLEASVSSGRAVPVVPPARVVSASSTRADTIPAVAVNLRLACSTTQSNDDSNSSVRAIHLLGRSDSETFGSASYDFGSMDHYAPGCAQYNSNSATSTESLSGKAYVVPSAGVNQSVSRASFEGIANDPRRTSEPCLPPAHTIVAPPLTAGSAETFDGSAAVGVLLPPTPPSTTAPATTERKSRLFPPTGLRFPFFSSKGTPR